MKVKRGGREREVWWTWEKRGWKLLMNFKNSKVQFLQENSYTFIASIYM